MYISANIQLSRYNSKDAKITTTAVLRSDVFTIIHESTTDEHLDFAIQQTLERLAMFVREGSDGLL